MFYLSTRHDGTLGFHTQAPAEEVLEHRQRLAKQLGIPLSRWVVMQQTHRANVQVISDSHAGRGAGEWASGIPDTDALVTDSPGLLLLAQGADCPLVGVMSSDKNVVAVIHSGWRGTHANIVHTTVDVMKARFAITPSPLHAFIAPAAAACCYEVQSDVADYFRSYDKPGDPEKGLSAAIHARDKKLYLDVRAVILRQLLNEGLLLENIEVHPSCTICDPEYFSYRREGIHAGRFGLGAWVE
jgi:YfiH family protein